MRTPLKFLRRDGDQFCIKGGAPASEVVWTSVALLGLFAGVFLPGVAIYHRGVFLALVLVLAGGLRGMVRRDEVRLDPRLRRWTRQTGYWLHRTTSGGFNELEGLVLTYEGVKRPRWLVHLAIRGDHQPVRVADFLNESKAYEQFGALARTLQLDAIDQTGHRETRLSLEPIERSLTSPFESRRSPSSTIPPLPAGSALHVAGAAPDLSIVLPALGFSLIGVVGVLLGSLFVGFGVILWINRVPDTNGLPAATYPLISCFLLAGIFIVLFTLVVCIRQEEFLNRGDRLVIGYRFFDRLIGAQVFEKKSIEEIAIRTVAGRTNYHVLVRSPNRLRRVGFTIGPRDQEWLQSTLTSWLAL